MSARNVFLVCVAVVAASVAGCGRTGGEAASSGDATGGLRPDHVVLSLGDDAETSRRISWRTSADVTESVLQYARVPDGPSAPIDFSGPEAVTCEGASVEHISNLGACRFHEVTVTGLVPGAEYLYRVGDGSSGGWSAPRSFEVRDPNRPGVRVAIMGDTRTRMDVWRRVISAIGLTEPDFIVHTGDLVADGRDMADWNAWFGAASRVLPSIPFMPVPGNHERQDDNFALAFALPRNAPTDELREECFSFDYGLVHWVGLNSCASREEQAAWLERDLARNTRPWVLTFYHHPLYAGHALRGDGDSELRELWGPAFDRHGVAIAWQGHDHYYYRTRAIREGEAAPDGDGTVYVTTGGGGAPVYRHAENRWMARGVDTEHYVLLTVTADSLVSVAYDLQGAEIDRFTILRASAAGER